MGNLFSVRKPGYTDDEIPTEYDMNLYKEKRERIFKGTIIVCVFYAIFAFLLLAISFTSESVKSLLLDKFLPFTSIYIIGTIIVIILLVMQIFDYKPIKHNRTNNYEDLSCPDYWSLESVPIDENTKDVFDPNVNYNLFKYRCKLNPQVFNKYDIYSTNSSNFHFTNLSSDLLPTSTNKQDRPKDNSSFTKEKINNSDNMHLYTNINNPNNLNILNKGFIEGSNIVYPEFVKNSLIMNNYSIDSNKTFTPLIDSNNFKNLSLNINKINFNSNISNDDYYNSTSLTKTIVFTYDSITKIRNIDYKDLLIKNSMSTTKSTTNPTCDKIEKPTDKGCYKLSIFTDSLTSNNKIGDINLDMNVKFLNFRQDMATSVSLQDKDHICYITEYRGDQVKTYNLSDAATKYIKDLPLTINVRANDYINNNVITANSVRTQNIPLVCDTVYPLFLASKDVQLSTNNKKFDQNVLRCAYSKMCNVPWSDLNCDKYNNV